MRFEDFDILINKGFSERYKEFDQYIAYGTIRINTQQIHIEEEDRTRLWKRQKILLNPVIERLTNLNNVGLLKDVVEDILKDTSLLQLKLNPKHIHILINV